jgi:hypothetical protein
MKPKISVRTFAITVAALALGVAPWARADEKACSEETLNGNFAYTATGVILTAPIAAIEGQSAEVGRVVFDGKGDVTFTFNSSQNGNLGPKTGTATGAYTVNSEDCTGTITHITPATDTTPEFTAHYTFAIDENGDEIQGICQDSGVVGTLVARRQWRR